MLPILAIHPSKYNRTQPNVGTKTIIGYIGLENLKFADNIKDETVNMDLNLHIDKAILKEQGLDVKLTSLLNFLLENEKRLNIPLENELDEARFFCYRGLLSAIAYTPYEQSDPWIIVALLHKGNIFLCKRHTEKKMQDIKNMTDRHKLSTSWGYKFEQFILSDKPDIAPNHDIPVNENNEFSLVFSSTINEHKIIFGAEMDGIRCDKGRVTSPPAEDDPEAVIKYLSSKEFIELKTCEHIDSSKKDYSFRRYKTMKWWCQSYFAGIDTILCGLRNRDGVVEELKFYHLDDLTKMARGWKPNVCLNFVAQFLTYVKRCFSSQIRRKHGDKAVKLLQTLPLMSIKFEWNLDDMVRANDDYSHEDDPILMDWFLEKYGKYRNADESQTSAS